MKKRVVIIGTFGFVNKVYYTLNYSEYEITAFIYYNEETWGSKILLEDVLIPVYAPKDIVKLQYDYIIISVAEDADDIKKDLCGNFGADENKIITFMPETEDIHWSDSRNAYLRSFIDTIKERKISGSIAELGVYKGDFAKLMNYFLPDRTLYLFDTFEGFDKRDSIPAGDESWFKDTSENIVLQNMPHPEKCIIKKGYFPETTSGVEDKFCLVSLDADLYEPILSGLEYFYPRLEKGGYIFIHDYGNYHFTGVKKAVLKFCMDNDISFVPVLDRCLSAVITK